MKTFLAIDFGTSQTSVAMLQDSSRYDPEIVEIDGQKTVPTALHIDADGNVLFFGKDAIERFHDDSGQTFYNFKAFIGRSKDYQNMTGQTTYTPESLSQIFLTYLREKIEKRYFNGAKLTDDPNISCVIGCPAEWNDPQKRKVEDIARQAGFPNVVHCEEPLGVIYYYHFRGDLDLSEDRNVLVYDFGGGTTDVAIEKVHSSDGGAVGVDVLAANGIANLGGMYFDRALADFFIGKLNLNSETLSLRDRQQIERYSRILKEDLSRRVEDGQNSAEVSIPMLRATKGGCTLSITKDEFNAVCADFIAQFDEPIYEALNFSTLMQDKVDRVILAGGSSALPYVRERITAIFPQGNVLTSASPTEVIAKGLAVYGRVVAMAQNAVAASPSARQEEKPAAPVQTLPLKKEQPAARRPETRPEEPKPYTSKPKSAQTGGNKKIWLAVAAVIVLVVIGGVFALKYVQPHDNVKEWLIAKVQDQPLALALSDYFEGREKKAEEALERLSETSQNPVVFHVLYIKEKRKGKNCDYSKAEKLWKQMLELRSKSTSTYTDVLPLAEYYVAKDSDAAKLLLGDMYQEGIGVEKNEAKALELFTGPADKGDVYGQVSMGSTYIALNDMTKAAEWYRKAAEQGYASAQNTLGDMYYAGQGVTQDYKQAAEWYLMAAEQGIAPAQCELGDMYCLGQGVTQDYIKAVDWYRKAAEQGFADAQLSLGYMYESGYGVAQDYKQAVELYRKSAEQGNAVAQNNLGVMYHAGRGVTQDYKQAAEWYLRAAEQGIAHAQCDLGDMYRLGQGVTQDYIKAVELYRKAAEQGNASAQSSLGFMYFSGYGVSEDYKQAAEWARKSAEQGYPTAQYNLGYMYESGFGVSKDLSKAKEWYQKAADQGYDGAKEALANLERRRSLTKDELIEIWKKSGLYLLQNPNRYVWELPANDVIYGYDSYSSPYGQEEVGVFLCEDKIYLVDKRRHIEALDYEQLRNDKKITRQWIENKVSSFMTVRGHQVGHDRIVSMLMAIKDKD